MPHEIVSAEVFADRFDLHIDTVRELCRNGKLPCQKLGKSWRIDITEYENGFKMATGEPPVVRPEPVEVEK